MGLYFNLFIETGERGNKNIIDYFTSINKLKVADNFYTLRIGSVENNIGITVSIDETGHTGLGDEKEKRFATKVGFVFYELLEGAPYFRYATAGVEAGEWADGQDILDENFDGYLPEHGLVVNNELEIDRSRLFIPFKNGYSWIPYKGET